MTKAIFNNKIEKPVWSKKNTIEHGTNVSKTEKYYSPLPTTTNIIASIALNEPVNDPNNIQCMPINIANNSNVMDLRCMPLSINNNKYYISSNEKSESGNPRNLKIVFSELPVNYDSTGKLITEPGPVTITLPITTTNTAILINDKYSSYMALPTSDDKTMPSNTPISKICNLVNTGTKVDPILICKEQLKSTPATILPPIVPANCGIVNKGTQTNPILACHMVPPVAIPEQPKYTSPNAPSGTVTNTSGTQTTGVKSVVNLAPVTEGTQSPGNLLKIQQESNPYSDTIKNLNKQTKWSCPTGYIAQYPNIVLTDCDSSGKCIDFHQNPAVLNEPCVGSASTSYKYNNDPYGVLDTTSDIKCEYGFPVFSGIYNKGKFNGNVMCLYQKGKGQKL